MRHAVGNIRILQRQVQIWAWYRVFFVLVAVVLRLGISEHGDFAWKPDDHRPGHSIVRNSLAKCGSVFNKNSHLGGISAVILHMVCKSLLRKNRFQFKRAVMDLLAL